MTDVDTRLLKPRDINLIVENERSAADPEDVDRVPIPGELGLDETFVIEDLRAEIWRSNLLRNGQTDPEVEASARADLQAAYRRGHALIQELAHRRNPDAPELDLTVTMVEAVLSMLVDPAERGTLLAIAYASSLGLEIDNGQVDGVPLDGGSPENSSPSDEPSEPRRGTGTTSRGASGSRTARRSAQKK